MYSKVQNKVNNKYDSWQKDLQSTFGSLLIDAMGRTLDKISDAKSKLEQISLEGATQETIAGVTYIQEMTQLQKIWGREAELLSSSESLLKKQRFTFPPQWTSGSTVRSCENVVSLFEN
jgi:dynein heavy chain 1